MSDVLVVLGAALRRDGRPRPALMRRVETAARLFGEGRACAILVTGGAPRNAMTEAGAMHAALIRLGVPAQAIAIEDRARDTFENARLSIPMLRRMEAERALVVTDPFHMRRALLCFRGLGMAAEPAPTEAGANPALTLREAAALALYLPRIALHRALHGQA